MGFLKLVFQFLMVILFVISIAAVYFSSQKQKISTVDLNSYLPDQINDTEEPQNLARIIVKSEQDVVDAIKSTSGPVTVSGVHYSLGGQVKYNNGLFLDMSHFNQVVDFDTEKKVITVQSGISWDEIQKIIDPHNLSVKIMQNNNDYSVGGSLSVNVYGRFIHSGPIINTVESIRVVLSDGKVYNASPDVNPALYYGVIGGYGGIGVIVQVTLSLTDNTALERHARSLSFNEFNNYFNSEILNDEKIVMHQAILYPPAYEMLLDISWQETDKALSDKERLQKNTPMRWWEAVYIKFLTRSVLLQRVQELFIDPFIYRGDKVENRNFEMSKNLNNSGFINSEDFTMAQQEYLIPLNRFEIFTFNLRDIFSRHRANIYKILINYIKRDKSNVLAGPEDGFYVFKIMYLQSKNKQSVDLVEQWTTELVRASLASNGSYILPYRLSSIAEKMYQAGPRSTALLDLKKKADPENRFRNIFWDTHRYAINRYDISGMGNNFKTVQHRLAANH